MSWLSTKWDELTGKNQKVGLDTIDAEYNKAFGTGREQLGFEGEGLGAVGREMMDPNSARNLDAKARMESSGADAAAESSRLAGRNAAMAGGAPAAALAAQTSQGANKAQAGAMGAFNQYLGGQFNSGVGMVSGAANNMTQMNQTQMNARSNQRQANATIDSQATGFGANLIGKGLGAMFNPMSALPIPGVGGQTGGYIGLSTGGMPIEKDPQNNIPMPESRNQQDYYDDDRYLSRDLEDVQSRRRGQEGYDFEGQPEPQDMSRWSFPNGAKFAPKQEEKWNSPYSDKFEELDAEMMKPDNWESTQQGQSMGDEMKQKYMDSQKNKSSWGSGMMGFQKGGSITPNSGGMLSQIMGPDGIPIHIRTRIGGQTIG
jgi:hypothetical protein